MADSENSPKKFFASSPWGDWGEYLLDKVDKSGRKGSMGAEIVLPFSMWYDGVRATDVCENCGGEASGHICRVRIQSGKISKISGRRGCKDFVMGWIKGTEILPQYKGREQIAEYLLKRLCMTDI